jgi:hypothetical protein
MRFGGEARADLLFCPLIAQAMLCGKPRRQISRAGKRAPDPLHLNEAVTKILGFTLP